MTRTTYPLLVLCALWTGVLAPGCGKAAPPPPLSATDELDAALAPAAVVAAFKKLGGAHFHASAYWRVTAPRTPAPDDADRPASPDAVTTTTDVWIDPASQYRLVETNDQDGGREVVLAERALSIALRYGKMIRRPAQEPEPTRYLQEALGAPGAAWDVVRRFALVDRAAGRSYHLRPSPTPLPVRPLTAGEPTALRKWRDTVAIESASGDIRLDEKTGAPLAFALKARFSLHREDEVLQGELAVTATIDDVGATPAIAPPVSEELRPRPRTVLDERALVGRPPR